MDKETKELIYNVQMNQKISIYMSFLSTFGMFVLGILWLLYYNGVFDSIVPVFILGFATMMYFFRTFISVKKHDFEKLPFFQKLISLRKSIRAK